MLTRSEELWLTWISSSYEYREAVTDRVGVVHRGVGQSAQVSFPEAESRLEGALRVPRAKEEYMKKTPLGGH